MERYQFINSLAQKAGVNDSESRLFTEIFLRKVYELIQPGDAIKLDGVGTVYFARTRFNKNISPENKDEFADVIVINDIQLSGNGTNKPVVFTLPAIEETKHNALDKFFSLSLSKPIVQNSNYSQNDIIPPTGDELEALLNSKTEKLLAEHQVLKNYIEPGLIVNPTDSIKVGTNNVEAKNNFDESFLDDDLDSLLLSDIKDEELLKELESIKWELDDESPESLIVSDILSEPDNKPDVEIEKPDETILEVESNLQESNEPEQTTNNFVEQNEVVNPSEEAAIEPEISYEQIINNKVIPDNSEFERVKSLSSEFREEYPETEKEDEEDAFQAAIDKVTKELESDVNTNENNLVETDSSEKNENEFVEVIPRSSIYNSNIINVIEAETKIEDEVKPEDEDTPEESKIDPEEYHRNALKEATKFVNERRSVDENKGKKRTIISLLIILGILLVLAASIFIYLKYIKTPESSLQGGSGTGDTVPINLVEVIERNYELPVTYPYPASRRNEFIHFDGIDSNIFVVNAALNNNVNENITTESGVTENATIPVKVDVTGKPILIRVKNNIYKSGASYIVQVASFKSKNIAESEAQKYSKQGNKTYIEEVEIPGRGIWFRLRIGNFASLIDAENFQLK